MIPELEHLEKERKMLMRKLSLTWTMGAVTMIVLFLIIGNSGSLGNSAFLLIVAAAVFFYVVFLHGPIQKANKLKDKLRSAMLNAIIWKTNADIQYYPTGQISREDFEKTHLFGRTDRIGYAGENYFCLEQPGYKVEFSTVIAARTNNEGQSTRPVFQGLFFVFTFPKTNDDRTLVVPESSLGAFEFVTDALDRKKYTGYEKIKSENTSFEEHFNLFTNSPVHAAKTIIPGLQDLLLQMRQKYEGDVLLSMGSGKTYLLINLERSCFHLSIENDFTNEELYQSFANDLKGCIEIAQSFSHYLNFNQ